MEMDVKFQPVSKRKRVIIWWLAGLVLSGGGLGWLVFDRQRTIYTPLSQPAGASLGQIDYQAFSSDQFKISFAYPASDWIINEKENGLDLISSASLRVMSKDRGGVNPEYANIIIEQKDISPGSSLESFVQERDPSLAEKYSQKKAIKINGRRALYFGDTVSGADQFPVLIIFVQKNAQEVLLITLYWFYDLEQNDLTPIFDKLITTFTFL